jgi:hypothetical protein
VEAVPKKNLWTDHDLVEVQGQTTKVVDHDQHCALEHQDLKEVQVEEILAYLLVSVQFSVEDLLDHLADQEED